MELSQIGIFLTVATEKSFSRAAQKLMRTQPFHALEYDGTTYDCGDKIGLLKANVAFALKRPDLGAEARAAIEALLRR